MATVITEEYFDRRLTHSQMELQAQLKLDAGALRSTIKDMGNKWLLETEWPKFG
ncbi:MAG: hypothetical protein Q7V04_05340 [Deltaproteobacteria bacterium]|nr:hypothetical protein [Deltaproteobacteria bacterium]